MKLFRIGFKNEPGMAWAGRYGSVDDPWFIPPTYLRVKKQSWDLFPEAPGLYIDSGGKFWPDILGCGASPPGFFVSDRVVACLSAIGAPMGRVTEMPIAEIESKALKNRAAPKYYVVETVPGIEVDLEATGFKVDAHGMAILNPPPDPWPSPFRYRFDSWNGTDLFTYRNLGPTMIPSTDMCCTERVMQLAEKEGWANVEFRPLELVSTSPGNLVLSAKGAASY